MPHRRAQFFLSIAYLLICPALFGWWDQGHKIVASIAEKRLNPKAQAAVAKILPKGESLESIASWADDVVTTRRETAKWHYINIPAGAARGDWARYCPKEECVGAAIPRMIGLLRNPSATTAQKAEALRFLVHFIGDLHEPLHAGERHDEGGNLFLVTFEGAPTNLHAVWDGQLLHAWFRQDPKAATQLRLGAPESERRALAEGTLDDWIWQAQAVSRDSVYAPLDRCRCNKIDEAYLRQAIPVLRLQLLRAGERLGRVLNETLGQ